MSDYPRNRKEMLRASYVKSGDGVCKGCGAAIEWWKTTRGKSMPFNPVPEIGAAVIHGETCPNRREFNGAANTAEAPAPGKFTFEREVRELQRKSRARVVVMVDDCGTPAAWASGIPAEELRHDLISAANFVRAEVAKKEAAL